MHRSIRNALILAPAAAALALPGAAAAKSYKVEASDPAGDGSAPARDITDVKLSYKTSGTLLVVVTLAAPIDATNADAAVNVSLGSSCKKIIGLGGGLLSDPGSAEFAGVKGKKIGKGHKGKAKIVNNVFELKFKNKDFKGWKPGCVAVALVDPNAPKDELPTPFDQTGEIKIK